MFVTPVRSVLRERISIGVRPIPPRAELPRCQRRGSEDYRFDQSASRRNGSAKSNRLEILGRVRLHLGQNDEHGRQDTKRNSATSLSLCV